MSTTDAFVVPPTPYRALVVEDDGGVGAFLTHALMAAGWDVVVASRISEAHVAIGDLSRPIDLAIVDVKLPDGDGMTLLPVVRGRPEMTDCVVMTAFRTEEILIEAMREGCVDFLTKPFGMTDIAGMLRRRTIRERQRLGLLGKRFERVDADIALVRREIHEMRVALDSWGAGLGRVRGSTG